MTRLAAALVLLAAAGAQAQEPPPPPSIAIPGIDVPAEGDVAPPPAPPDEEPSGPVHLTPEGAPQLLTPRIVRGKGYFGLGAGVGLANFARESFGGNGAGVFGLRFGKIVGHQLLFGPEIALTGQYAGWKVNQMVGAGISSIMGQLTYFPFASVPLSVAGGAGWGSGLQVSRLNEAAGNVPIVAEGHDGVSWMAGLGWDFFAGPGWNLGLQLRHDGVHFQDAPDVAGYTFQIWLNSY